MESWQAVGGVLGGMSIISAAYLTILKLVIKSSILELDQKHREWCNGKFVSREVLEEKFEGLSKWAATIQGDMSQLSDNVNLLLQLKQGAVREKRPEAQ